jgi:hypothetical protein
VEGLDGAAEDRRVATDLAQRRQPQVPVERGVLDALGHDRPAGLLEAGDELRAAELGEREPPHDVGLAGAVGERGLRGRHGCLHVHPGDGAGRALGGQVRAVDVERDEHLDERLAEGVPGHVEPGERGLGGPDEPVDLGDEHPRQHLPLRAVHDRVVRRPVPEGVERLLAVGLDEQPHHLLERVVAGGPGAGPGRQVLAGLEDLLGHDPGPRGLLGQPGEVTLRVGEAVRVVDAQAVDDAVADLLQHQGVGRVEDRRVLDAHAREGGHVEEPPVGELVAAAPERQPVVLPSEGLLQVTLDESACGHGELVLVVDDAVLLEPEVAEGLGQGCAENGQQERAGRPVDVEPRCVRRGGSLLEQRPPGGVVLLAGDRHVVGHDVEHDAEAVRAARRDQGLQARLPAELAVDPAVVDHVVAVLGVPLGLQPGAAVDVRDPQVGEVGHDGRRVGEGEVRRELHPVGAHGLHA